MTLIAAAFGACAKESVSAPVAACEIPRTIDSPDGLPPDFPWPDGVDPTEAQVRKKFVSMEGFSELSVEELLEIARPLLLSNGFDVNNNDFEGFEAELYFAKSADLAGIVSMREGPCDGYVKVNVIYDPLETAAGRDAVKRTRELS